MQSKGKKIKVQGDDRTSLKLYWLVLVLIVGYLVIYLLKMWWYFRSLFLSIKIKHWNIITIIIQFILQELVFIFIP